jgi:hypothetical protein
MAPTYFPTQANPPAIHHHKVNTVGRAAQFTVMYAPGIINKGGEHRTMARSTDMVRPGSFEMALADLGDMHQAMTGLFESFERDIAEGRELNWEDDATVEREFAALMERLND